MTTTLTLLNVVTTTVRPLDCINSCQPVHQKLIIQNAMKLMYIVSFHLISVLERLQEVFNQARICF
jgi:hypothetical protein